MTPAVERRDVQKYYGTFHALADINPAIAKGEKEVICGPSGSGGSTLLRTINQLSDHQPGEILIDGQPINAGAPDIKAMRREIAMCFQHFNLFPHLTIPGNGTLAPMLARKTPRAEAGKTAMAFLKKFRVPTRPGNSRDRCQACSSNASPLPALCA